MAIRVRDIGLRAASALVLAPAAGLATWAGGLWFLALMLAACALLSSEWATMSSPGHWRGAAASVFLAVAAAMAAAFQNEMSAAFILLVFGAALAGQFAKARGLDALNAAYGVLYLGWPAVLLVWLRDGQSAVGLHWLVFVFAVTWSADIMAYVAGSLFGGPKLWPRFSPNKTWSGFIGGLTAGTVAGGIVAWLTDLGGLGALGGAVLGLAAALATMAGDLWESALKRRFGVKDAGTIIPGHGGLLDRVDGMMFAAVIVAAGRVLLILWQRAA